MPQPSPSPRPLRATLQILAASMTLALSPSLTAQQEPEWKPITDPSAPTNSSFDPSEAYFQGWLLSRDAENLEKDGDVKAADAKLDQASKLFDAIRTYYPDWRPEMVKGRLEKTTEVSQRVKPLAEAARNQEQRTMAELEGGKKSESGNAGDKKAPVPIGPLAPTPGQNLDNQRLGQLEREVKALRSQLAHSSENSRDAIHNESRLRDVERQRDVLQSQLSRSEADLQALRARMAAAPVRSEVDRLNQRIDSLESERQAMAMALSQSSIAKAQALAKGATLEADLKTLSQQAADLERNLKLERQTANDVVAGQQQQLSQLQKAFQQKERELSDAQSRITSLEEELTQSRGAFSQLREERDGLLRDREQMSKLLKLNESGRVRDLIDQNLALAKQLRESQEKFDRVLAEDNQTKDDYTEALRDLAIAKASINKLQREKREQDKRITDLETRLHQEETQLAANPAGDPTEVQMLRDVIKKQLRAQTRRRQARELLVDAAKQLGEKNELMQQAMNMLDGDEVTLTPEEQKVIASNQVDGEIFSTASRSNERLTQATQDLQRQLSSYDEAAKKAFLSNRLLPARELYEMSAEAHPGKVDVWSKLGVVNLKLEDHFGASEAFRRATDLDPQNSYVHRMLGYAYMLNGNLEQAQTALSKAVELAPDDAKAHATFGTLSYKLGQYGEAESHFRAAIVADATLSEPYYNLAFLCVRNGKLKEARQYYDQALELGAAPDPSLEKSLE